MHDGILNAQRTGTILSSAALQIPRRKALLACLVPLLCSARDSAHDGGAAASPPIADNEVVWMSGPLIILRTEEKPAQTFLKYEG
jgi:hypothetical protein